MIPDMWQEYFCVDEFGMVVRRMYRGSADDIVNVLIMNVFKEEDDAVRKAGDMVMRMNSLRHNLKNAKLEWY